jgi:mRNA-degrading endonuclease RelE of RelBE toxin-antitoxin system
MTYTVRLKPRAERELDQLPISVAKWIWQQLLALNQDLYPCGESLTFEAV